MITVIGCALFGDFTRSVFAGFMNRVAIEGDLPFSDVNET